MVRVSGRRFNCIAQWSKVRDPTRFLIALMPFVFPTPCDVVAVAASRGKLESVKQLIELGGDPNRVDDFGLTPLYEAVTHGHTEVIKYLTILGADLGLRSARVWDPEGMDKRDAGTLMCQVCSEGNLKMLKALLRGGVHPDSHDYDGRTGALRTQYLPFRSDNQAARAKRAMPLAVVPCPL